MHSIAKQRRAFLLSTSILYHPDPTRIWIVELQELCLMFLLQQPANDQ